MIRMVKVKKGRRLGARRKLRRYLAGNSQAIQIHVLCRDILVADGEVRIHVNSFTLRATLNYARTVGIVLVSIGLSVVADLLNTIFLVPDDVATSSAPIVIPPRLVPVVVVCESP